MKENCLSTVALFPMKKSENDIRSAALSQKAALQMRENPQIFPIYK